MKLAHRLLSGFAFFIPFFVYLSTMAPTTSFWDCGEFIATSYIMGVPHPPGSPLFLLLGNVFTQLPVFADVGARVNLISPIVSAFAVMFLYLIVVQCIEEWRGKVRSVSDAVIAYGSSFVAAMTFSFTDSHWFNAVETEVYSISTFFTAIVIWLILKWAQNEGKPGNVRYILLISYMLGLATGIHLLNLLALPFISLIIYYRKYSFNFKSLFIITGITGFIFLVIYLGIIKGLPQIANSYGVFLPLALVLGIFIITIYSVYQKKHLAATILTSLTLILIGYSTYTTIFIRATQHPIINENNPDTSDGAVRYLNREQYGDWSILDRKSTLQRPENSYWKRYTLNKNRPKTSEAWGFFWNYQIKEMYLRYFAWQFIGRGDFDWPVVNLKGTFIKYLQGINIFRYGLPLAFFLGIAGMLHHFYRDWKRALAVLVLFLSTGLLIIIYLNQYDPQPRERDYSYVGSFFAFSIWIGIGIAGIMERIKEFLEGKNSNLLSVGALIVLLTMMPIKMFATDYREHNRSGNFVAWDYAYNMLNSCEPNGIIFTNGDNDTFPLWYIQEVEGVRKDVRVVNLSLLNTPWYIFQLRDDSPTIPLKIDDNQIKNITPIEWKSTEVSIPGPKGDSTKITWKLEPTYAQYFLRVQDIMIWRIIKDMEWERPIYFAVTVSPNNLIGLQDYLQMEGLVYRLRPQKGGDINYNRMEQNITETNNLENLIRTAEDYEPYISKGEGVYRYRNLNNPEVYYNSNILRLVQNYRSSFLQLALNNAYSQSEEEKAVAVEVLKKMDSYFPREVLPINNPDLELQIARLYYMGGDEIETRDRLSEIRGRDKLSLETEYTIGKMYLDELSDYSSAVETFKKLHENQNYSQYFEIMISLVQAYARDNQQEEAVSVLEAWLLRFPDDDEAKKFLEILKIENL